MTAAFEELSLLPGQQLVVEFDSYKSFRDKSIYMGMKRNGSIIITTPIVGGGPVPVHIGQGLNVRFLANQANCVCAFRSEVLHVSKNPYNHLHLVIPDKVVTGEVRNSIRARVNLKAQVVFGKTGDSSEDTKVTCSVLDLSVNGAKLEGDLNLGKSGVRVTLLMKLKVHEIAKVIKVDTEIKSLTHDERRNCTVAGLQFHSLSENDRLMLYAFVYSHLFEPL